MKKIMTLLLIMVVANLFATKYAGEIFSIGAGVRNYALGGIGLSDAQSPAIAYWNPALLTNAEKQIELLHAEEFSGLLKFDTFSAVFGKRNAYSVVLTRIGIDNIPLTKWDDEYNRPYKYKSVNNSDMVCYFGFNTQIKGFSVGFSPKFAYRTLSDESGFGFGADISSYINIKDNWIFFFFLKDLFSSQILWSTDTHEVVYPSLSMESNYKFNIPMAKKEAHLFLGTDIYAEGREMASTIHAGALSADFHAGLETIISEKLSIYLGYDVSYLTGGLTAKFNRFKIDYAFEQNSDLNNSHRLSIG